MTDETLPDHIFRPHLRPVQPLPIQKDGRQFVALRDPTMLQKQTMVVPVQAMPILQSFVGKQSIEELASQREQPAIVAWTPGELETDRKRVGVHGNRNRRPAQPVENTRVTTGYRGWIGVAQRRGDDR